MRYREDIDKAMIGSSTQSVSLLRISFLLTTVISSGSSFLTTGSVGSVPRQSLYEQYLGRSRVSPTSNGNVDAVSLPSFEPESASDLLSVAVPFGVASVTSGSALVELLFTHNSNLMEAQVLNDVSHLSLDLATFFLGPGAIVLRFAAVVGRLCSMAADYLPDQSMMPEEMVFQAFMLILAITSLARAAVVPYVAASAPHPTLRDGRTFRALFEPAGVTWSQYKAVSAYTFEWITLKAGESVPVCNEDQNESCMYWVYNGSVQVEETPGHAFTATRLAREHGTDGQQALFGERQLLHHVVTSKQRHSASSVTSARVVSADATLLRIRLTSLKTLTDNDPDLQDAVRNLLFQSMEAKMNTCLTATSNDGHFDSVVPVA